MTTKIPTSDDNKKEIICAAREKKTKTSVAVKKVKLSCVSRKKQIGQEKKIVGCQREKKTKTSVAVKKVKLSCVSRKKQIGL